MAQNKPIRKWRLEKTRKEGTAQHRIRVKRERERERESERDHCIASAHNKVTLSHLIISLILLLPFTSDFCIHLRYCDSSTLCLFSFPCRSRSLLFSISFSHTIISSIFSPYFNCFMFLYILPDFINLFMWLLCEMVDNLGFWHGTQNPILFT